MKTLRIPLLVLLLILFLIPTLAFTQDTFIWTHGHHEKLGRINDRGIVYNNGERIGSVKNGLVYDSPYGGMPVGRIDESGKLWNQEVGGRAVGRYENGKVYNRSDRGGRIIGVSKNKDGASFFLLKEGWLPIFCNHNKTKKAILR